LYTPQYITLAVAIKHESNITDTNIQAAYKTTLTHNHYLLTL